MAKIKKRKLSWNKSPSPQVIGYKLYWSDDGKVDYDSPSEALGNVTEVLLPDGLEGFSPVNGPVAFGITAMDELGNESDMVTFLAEYQFNAPQAPQDLRLEELDEFHATGTDSEPEPESESGAQPIQLYEKAVYCLEEHKAQSDDDAPDDSAEEQAPQRLKYFGRMEQD